MKKALLKRIKKALIKVVLAISKLLLFYHFIKEKQ